MWCPSGDIRRHPKVPERVSMKYHYKLSKRHGSVSETVTVVDRTSGRTKVISDETHELEVKRAPKGYVMGTVSVRNGVTLSLGYQSARIDIGGDLPFPMRPGNVEDFGEGMDVLERYVDDRLVKKARGLREFLKKVGG
jgi:hypothetical protein